MEGVFISIENVVVTAILDKGLNLKLISKLFPDRAEYDPAKFPGLLFRIRRPRASALIFSSGKIVCTGARSEREARVAVDRIVAELRRRGVSIGDARVKVENVVATGSLGVNLPLEELALSLDRCIYEPEQFPGIIHRMEDPKVVFLLFSNGKFVCTGARTERDVTKAVSMLRKLLESRGFSKA